MLHGTQSFYQGGSGSISKVIMPVKVTPGRTTLETNWEFPDDVRECEVKLTGNGEFRTTLTGDESIHFDDLTPGTEYKIIVTPVTPQGRGTSVVRRVVTERDMRLPCINISGREIPEDSEDTFPIDVSNDSYENICGEECIIDNTKYKFVSFECGSIANRRNFFLKIHGMEGPWKEHCGTLCCTTLHVKIYGSDKMTGWMNANRQIVPFSDTIYNDGYRCLRSTRSKMDMRSISFGGNIFSGSVVCRVGLPRDGKKISGISVL